jgi:hypothetical protein
MAAVALLGAAAVFCSIAPLRAQQGNDAKPANEGLFNGGDLQTEGSSLGAWGSGKAQSDGAYRTIGERSIRIETNGYYSGGRIQFTKPRDITDVKADPYAYMEFICRFQPGTLKKKDTASPLGSPMGPGGAGYPGGMGGAFPGSGMLLPGGGGTNPGFPGLGGGVGGAGSSSQESIAPDTSRIKVILNCEEGSFVASNFPVVLNPADQEGWFSVAIPFVAFKGLDKAPSAKVKEIRIFGDSKDTFWIGEIRTTTDDEPISVDALDDLEVSKGEPVELRAQATGGISPLQYTWDFDLSDGIQEDAFGPSVVHTFRKESPTAPGNQLEVQPYVVTVTVKDLSGAKKPVRRQAAVIVNP